APVLPACAARPLVQVEILRFEKRLNGSSRQDGFGHGLARHLLLIASKRLAGGPKGFFPHPRCSRACRKVLKIERLEVLHGASRLPSFRQASEGRKRESVWVKGRSFAWRKDSRTVFG